MRLPDFILENTEPILRDWEAFARSVWPAGEVGPLVLRDHAENILRATAQDMRSSQTARQQSKKSKGEGDAGEASDGVDGASDIHAAGRVRSGFDILAIVAEYRALRASVIRLWRETGPDTNVFDLDDITRFNESIDQSLTKAIRSFTVQVDRSRQMFLAILSHDLRNPLNSMMMSAQELSYTDSLDELPDVASRISASATAMGQMIGDLLDFTNAGIGAAMPISPASMDLRSLCLEVIDEMRAAYPTRTVEFMSEGDLIGECDSARLRQVVSNLLGNAIQHGSDTVTLSAVGEPADVRLSVHNGGDPIPPDAIPTIFDPLTRGTIGVRKKRRPGSIGLGLYVVRLVATAHGGSVNVTSLGVAGTTFVVHLPRQHSGK